MAKDWMGKTITRKKRKSTNAFARMKTGGVAQTREDYEMGLLNGKNIFPFSHSGPHNMTMNPKGNSIPYPVIYAGYDRNNMVDFGIAQPNQDFTVIGDTVVEYPLLKYQMGNLVPESSWQKMGKPYVDQRLMPDRTYQEGDWQLGVKTALDVYGEKAKNYTSKGGYEAFPPRNAAGRTSPMYPEGDSQFVAELNEQRFGTSETDVKDPNNMYNMANQRAIEANQYSDFEAINNDIKQRLAQNTSEEKSPAVEAENASQEENLNPTTIKKPTVESATKTGNKNNVWSDFVGVEGKKRLQTMLADLGFYEGPIDGILARLTGDAVEKFQKSYGLTPDRIAGVNTLTKLKEVYKVYDDVYGKDKIQKGQSGLQVPPLDPIDLKIPDYSKLIQQQKELALAGNTDPNIFNPDSLYYFNRVTQLPELSSDITYGRLPYDKSGNPQITKVWGNKDSKFSDKGNPDRPSPVLNISSDTSKDNKIGNPLFSQYNDPNTFQPWDLPLSAMYNLGTGLFEKAKKYPIEYNEYAPQVLSGLASLKFTPDFNPIRLAQNVGLNTVRNNVTNIGSMMANQANMINNTQRNMADLIRNSEDLNNKYAMTYYDALNKEGLDRRQQREIARDLNDRAKAAKRQFTQTGLAQMDDYASRMRELANQRFSNELSLNMINTQNPNYVVMPDENGNLISYYRNLETGQLYPINNTSVTAQQPKFKAFARKRKKGPAKHPRVNLFG